jgi:predicted NAD/FAD-binding protein
MGRTAPRAAVGGVGMGGTVVTRLRGAVTPRLALNRPSGPSGPAAVEARMRIAVVGSGIAGAGAAWLLARRHEVTLFERAARPGGHTDTLDVPAPGGGTRPVDTGFIVLNDTTYPLLTRLLDELGVATRASDMSWSLTCARCDLEYAGSARGAVAQPQRALDPRHLRMLVDVARFNRLAAAAHAAGTLDDGPLDAFLRAHRLGDGLRRHYLLPMAAAIWSSGTSDAAGFPTRSLVAFFANHGLLGVRSHLRWRTVVGGARTYLERLLAPLAGRVRTGTPVVRVARPGGRPRLTLGDGSTVQPDAVVLAGHADDTLALLEDPSDDERELLGAWRASRNERWVHTDAGLLPRRRAAWASWNYHVDDCARPTSSASLDYLMNRLQGLEGPERVLVSINPPRPPRPDTVLRRDVVTHPTFDAAALATQPRLDELNGVRGTFVAGAWQRWGFHEDGLWSAVRVAAHLGVAWP